MKKRQLLALLLAVAMIFSVIAYSPMPVYADEGGESSGGDSGGGGGSESGGGGSESGGGGSESGGGGSESGGGGSESGGGDSGSGSGDSGSGSGDSGSGGDSGGGYIGGEETGGDSGSGDSGSGSSESSETPSDIDLSDIQWFPLFSYDNYIKDAKAPKGNDRITYVPAEEVPMRERIEGAEVSFTEERISIPNGMQIDLNSYVSAVISETPAADLIDWETSDPTIATVDENGFLTGITMGSCWIYAYLGTEQASIFVEVDPNEASPLPYEHTYAIRMNRSYNNMTVYLQDENGEYSIPFRTFRCAGGYRSPYGVQHILYQMEWNPMNGNHWAHWCAQIFNSFMMHSTPYYYRNQHSLIYHNYQEFGTTASAGCVRLLVRDAKWVYDNCNQGTIMDYYFDLENPGPLGKNEVIYLPRSSGWEPTDPDAENPWFEGKPAITGVCDMTTVVGKTVDYFSRVTCTDSRGDEISSNLRITSGVDINTPGTYPVVYKLTDAAYKTVYAYCYVTVTEAAPEAEAAPATETASEAEEATA